MSRLKPNLPRIEKEEETYLGRVLLFCEGSTEENYFNYFAKIINEDNNKYSELMIVTEDVGGNARRVLKYAEEFFIKDNNAAKYTNYEKHLIFDCDAPKGKINEVIKDMITDREHDPYELSPTNYLFETWLLMHFEDVKTKLSKRKTYERLEEHLNEEYDKNSVGIIRKIIGDGIPVKNAINNAKALVKKYEDQGLNYEDDIYKMNPFTMVHILVKRILRSID